MTSKTNKGGGRKSSASDIIAISSINEVPKWKNIRGSYTGKEEEENEEEDTVSKICLVCFLIQF